MTEFDRNDIMRENNYNFNNDALENLYSSQKSWWFIGILIGFVMNFIAFLSFYVFHKREHFKKAMT
jgi:hypothetical protein